MVLNGIIRTLLYIGKVARVDVETMSDHVSHYRKTSLSFGIGRGEEKL
jgi:hypothetical protein